MNVLSIGGSKNVGYHAAVRLLATGSTVTFLLRNIASFEGDEVMRPYIDSGKSRLVQGDALNEEDIGKAWQAASEGDKAIDLIIFTVGGAPHFSLSKGFYITPGNLCSQAMLNVLSTYSRSEIKPKLVVVSAGGLDKKSHKSLPFVLKPLYSYALTIPHVDKLGMERVVAHAAGWEWEDEEPKSEILSSGWKDRISDPGFLKQVVIVRPAIFTDGECKGEKTGGAGYRVSEKDLSGSYTVSRKDVAHFIVEKVLKDWNHWEGKRPRIAY